MWLFAGVPLGLLAAVLDLLLVAGRTQGTLWWKAWEHPAGASWHWVPFIHPPLFTQYMRGFEQLANDTGHSPEWWLVRLSAGLAPLIVLLGARAGQELGGHRAAALTAALLAISPALMRPFEQYPLSNAILTATLLAVVLYARRGGAVRWGLATALAVLTVNFHLSSWFIVGPVLGLGVLALPGRRRGFAVMLLGALLLFGYSTQGGVFGNTLQDVLDQPGVRRRDIFAPPGWRNLTFERSNPLLYLPMLLWFVPSLRRGRPILPLLTVGFGLYVLAHLLLMQQGLAINSNAPEPHHYFEMIEPLVTACSLAALVAAAQAWPRLRGAVGLASFALLVTHALLAWRLVDWMQHAARYPH